MEVIMIGIILLLIASGIFLLFKSKKKPKSKLEETNVKSWRFLGFLLIGLAVILSIVMIVNQFIIPENVEYRKSQMNSCKKLDYSGAYNRCIDYKHSARYTPDALGKYENCCKICTDAYQKKPLLQRPCKKNYDLLKRNFPPVPTHEL